MSLGLFQNRKPPEINNFRQNGVEDEFGGHGTSPKPFESGLTQPETLVLERIEKQESHFRIFVSTRQSALCPVCAHESTSRHSGYSRRLADLPWQGCSVQLWLSVHKYRCQQKECPRRVFCQRVPGVAQVYARRTERLAVVVGAVGYVAGTSRADCPANGCCGASRFRSVTTRLDGK